MQKASLRRLAEHRLAAVSLQIEQMLIRLKAVALWQAARAAAGWRIAYVEKERQQLEALLDVDGRPLTISGRIDRIDVHADSGRLAFHIASGRLEGEVAAAAPELAARFVGPVAVTCAIAADAPDGQAAPVLVEDSTLTTRQCRPWAQLLTPTP